MNSFKWNSFKFWWNA